MAKRYRIIDVSLEDGFYPYRDQLIGMCFSVGNGLVEEWPDGWYLVEDVVGLPVTLDNGETVEAGECLFEVALEEIR